MAVRVSVIVVNWNGLEMTASALQSLDAHAGVECEVLVVDNGSQGDEGPELLRRFPRIKLLANEHNEGFSRACNRAARVALGEYLLFLNNDTVQIEDALGLAVGYLDQRPELGVLGIKHLDSSASWQPSAYRFPRVSQDLLACLGLGFLSKALEPYPPTASADVDWVCGSFFLVRRSVWQAVGEFDERFFVYDEDIDWCRRAWREGIRVRFWPGASMVHLGAASAPGLRDKTFMHFRSRLTYYAKNEPRIFSAAFYAAMSLRLSASSLLQLAKFGLGKSDARSVKERLRRLATFVSLRSARAGVKAV